METHLQNQWNISYNPLWYMVYVSTKIKMSVPGIQSALSCSYFPFFTLRAYFSLNFS